MERPKSYDILEADPDISIKGGWWCRKKRIATQFVLRNRKKKTLAGSSFAIFLKLPTRFGTKVLFTK